MSAAQAFVAYNNWERDDRGPIPFGGYVEGIGLSIKWQTGPLVKNGERVEPNGAFVETVIAAAIQRLNHYQESRFRCAQNETAIYRLTEALAALEQRTADREARGVEGTHEV